MGSFPRINAVLETFTRLKRNVNSEGFLLLSFWMGEALGEPYPATPITSQQPAGSNRLGDEKDGRMTSM